MHKLFMKTLFAVFGFSLLSSVLALQGAERPGPYAKIDIGGVVQQDLKIKTLDGFSAPDSKFTFDPGVRFGLAGGYNFNESLAAELEIGMTFNEVDEIRLLGTVLPRIEPEPIFFGPEDEGRRALGFYQVPIMANVIYTLPLSSRFRPFVGAGAGGIASIFSGEFDHDSDFTFGYQGQAGFIFVLNEHMDVGVTYKFMSTPFEQRYFFDFGEIKTDPTYSHSIVAAFTFNF
jgi:opacity protein-like surface antigen